MHCSTKEDQQPMPIWVSNNHLSPQWVQTKTGIENIKLCEVNDISNENKKADSKVDGTTLRVSIVVVNNDDKENVTEKLSLIIKQATDKGSAHSKKLGLAREALFYDQLAHDLPLESAPKIFYSYGDLMSGRKCIIMEDIQNSIDSGVLFGPGNPNNWKRNLNKFIFRTGPTPPSSKEVALVTFRAIAKIHAIYWRRDDLLSPDKSWLRGQQWLRGQDKESWEASQNLVCLFWKKYLDLELNEEYGSKSAIDWDENVRSAVEKAVSGISWEAQLKRLNSEHHWTLVHGDFWPGNIMWMTKEKEGGASNKSCIRFIDWEMVGLGSGPQDLGQYIISSMSPTERRMCELELVQAYFEELNLHNNSINCTFDYCWQEYKVGAVERWIWFLSYFVGNGMSDWGQYFHNQISSFMRDHKMTSDDITQPRP